MLAEALPPAFGGAVYQALRLANELRNAGVEIILLGRQPDGHGQLDSTLEGFPVFRVGVGMPHTGKWTKFRALLGYLAVLTRERRRFEILHIHGPYYLLLFVGLFARAILRKKLVLKLTSTDFDTPSAVKRSNYGRFSWFCYRQADAYACISSAQYEECRTYGIPEKKLFRTPNGVETTRFHPVQSTAERTQTIKRLGLPPQFRYITFIGSIQKLKGIDLLVEIAAEVCHKHPDVKFLLIGPDGQRAVEKHINPDFIASIRSRLNALNLADRVLLLGHQTNTDDYLRAATAFAFTSRSEGFGTAVIEAMASGLPCVVFDIPGVTRDIISSDQDGIIIPGEDVQGFATAINRILNEPAWADQLGEAARRAVLERYAMPAVARRYQEMYRKMLSCT